MLNYLVFSPSTSTFPFGDDSSKSPRLVEAHVFSFVVGRAFVTDVEKLRIHSKSKSLRLVKIMDFFSEVNEVGSVNVLFLMIEIAFISFFDTLFMRIMQDGINAGFNLLLAVETLVSGVCLSCAHILGKKENMIFDGFKIYFLSQDLQSLSFNDNLDLSPKTLL